MNMTLVERESSNIKLSYLAFLDATKDEMKSLPDNFGEVSKGKDDPNNNWIYRMKHKNDFMSSKYNVIIEEKDFSQIKNVHQNDIH